MAKYIDIDDIEFTGLTAEESIDALLADYGVGKGERLALMGHNGSVEGETLDNWVELREGNGFACTTTPGCEGVAGVSFRLTCAHVEARQS